MLESDGYGTRTVAYMCAPTISAAHDLTSSPIFSASFPTRKYHGEKVELPKRSKKDVYDDIASIANRRFVPEKY